MLQSSEAEISICSFLSQAHPSAMRSWRQSKGLSHQAENVPPVPTCVHLHSFEARCHSCYGFFQSTPHPPCPGSTRYPSRFPGTGRQLLPYSVHTAVFTGQDLRNRRRCSTCFLIRSFSAVRAALHLGT